MSAALALLDSNVIVATVVSEHQNHLPSVSLFERYRAGSFAVAAHSFAESYVTLTKRGPRAPFEWDAADAWTSLQSVVKVVQLVGLSPAATLDSLRTYASRGHTGARLYDWLIGQSGELVRVPAIVTWNSAHFTSLFPTLPILTPSEFMEG